MAGPYGQAIQQQAGAPAAEQDAMARVQNFDPQAAVEQSAKGAFGSFRTSLSKEISRLRGTQAGAGRVQTGFGFGDEDQLVSDLGDRYTNELQRNSMQAASLDQQNRQFGASTAQENTSRYYDLLGGNRDYETADQNAKNDRKRRMLSGIGTALGAGVGAVAGSVIPGAGTLAGAGFGAKLGGSFGEIFA